MCRTQTQHFMINLSNASQLSIDCYDVSFSSCIFIRLLLHRSDCTRRVRTYMNSIMCTKLWQLIYSYWYCPCPIACGVRICAAAIVSNVSRLSPAICRFNTFTDSMTKTNAIHCCVLSRSNSNSERVRSVNIRFVCTCDEWWMYVWAKYTLLALTLRSMTLEHVLRNISMHRNKAYFSTKLSHGMLTHLEFKLSTTRCMGFREEDIRVKIFLKFLWTKSKHDAALNVLILSEFNFIWIVGHWRK